MLIVEDDRAMAGLVGGYLARAGYTVAMAETGEEGIALAQQARPHLILLDLMLPGQSGWATCRALRARADVPIIMVTARRAEEDRLRGFTEGADDYVTKPFSPRELVARVGAVLRRHRPALTQDLTAGPIAIDPRCRVVRVRGVTVALRAREFDLLAYLVLHQDRVCSRADLLDHVWGFDFAGDERTVDTHVRRIREALGPDGGLVKTIWGIGYRLSAGDP